MELAEEYVTKELNGVMFRCVKPYDHTYLTYCKERWRNRNIFTMFLTEFKAYDEGYYKEAIQSGLIQVNSQVVDLDYTLRNGDKITHSALRNEPPVLNTAIQIISDLPNILVVHKPSSMPVHPSGAYYKNSMLYILEHEMGFSQLHLIHRLDRLTSGIIILAKNPKMASTLTSFFQSHSTKKYYVARVKGNFPYLYKEINEKIACLSHKDGVYKVDPMGKHSITLVKKMFYDAEADESVLECQLLTGRTHQIRVHLSHLGYPIANDVCYGGQLLNPIEAPESLFRLEHGNKKISLDSTKQMEIWLHSFRYVLTQNLDFSTLLPNWALHKYVA